MFDPQQYELVDFGDGAKVERFGGNLIARESPSVEMFDPNSPIAVSYTHLTLPTKA